MALLPLLHGSVVVDGIRVSGLKARVIKEKDGRFNFSDLAEAQPSEAGTRPKDAGAAKKPAEKKAEERKDARGKAVAFDIGSVQVDRSAVTYIDKASGQELALSDVKLSTGRIAERADGKLELKAAAKGKNPDLDLKLSVAGNYKVDLPAKAFEIAKLDAAVNGAAAGITNLDLKAKGDVAANPEKDEYRVKGFAVDFKGVQEKQNMEAHIAAPELVVAADKAKGAAVTAELKMKDGQRDVQANRWRVGCGAPFFDDAEAERDGRRSGDCRHTDPPEQERNHGSRFASETDSRLWANILALVIEGR